METHHAARDSPSARRLPSWAVVIPAYNEADRIGDALQSLREQDEAPDEIIVVDDGSEDDLVGAIEGFRDLVQVIRQPNRGLSAARNRGAEAVTSDWILFLDADDWLQPDFLAASRAAVEAHPAVDIVAADALGVDESSGAVLYRHYERARFVDDDQRLAIVSHNFMLTGVSVRTRPWLSAGRFDESLRVCEDWDCWARMILGGSHAVLADTLLYRRHHGSNLSSNRTVMLAGRLAVLKRLLAREDLRVGERRAIRRSLRENERALRTLEVREELTRWVRGIPRGSPGVAVLATKHRARRREAKRLLLRPRTPPRLRVALVGGVLSPTLTALVLRRRPRYAGQA